MDALLSTGALPVGGFPDYDIDHSVKMEGDNSEYLTKTYSSAGNSKTWTLSVWVKRTEYGTGGTGTSQMIFGAGDTYLHFLSSDKLYANLRTASTNFFWGSDRLFRDTAAWYHIVMAVDTTQGTAADRVKVYVNGEQQTPTETGYQNISQNADTRVNSAVEHEIGKYTFAEVVGMQYAEYFHGYMSDMYVIDGSAKAPTDFGRYNDNGVWIPKAYSGSYGTNGFFLDFADAADLGDDESGNGNDWTEVNLTAADQATDTPTNNFCTMNQNARTNGNIRTQEGGTYVTTDGGSGWCSMLGTMGMSAGKWYWEALVNDNGDALTVYVGIAPHNDPYVPHNQTGYYLGNVETAGSMGWYLSDGSNKNQNGSWGNPGRGDKIMFAYDADNYKMYYGINGTWGNSANPANGTGSVTAISTYWMSAIHNALDFVLPAVTVYQGKHMKGFNFGGYCAWTISSGNTDANGYGNFEYAPPSGFYALCSKNLAQYG